jgi:diadenosine tetraphosphatase ApaH/serine/threonine PP2A family protein phosphatase
MRRCRLFAYHGKISPDLAELVSSLNRNLASRLPTMAEYSRMTRKIHLVEHDPWIDERRYHEGIDGQRVAVVGYSHYEGEDEPDGDDFTTSVVQRVISGEYRLPFFTNIRNYFGADDHASFWPRVLFFNYLPDYIGGRDKKFEAGSPAQIERAQQRFKCLIRRYEPHKVIAFSKKAWTAFPETSEEESSVGTYALDKHPPFRWGTYTVGKHRVLAFGLRHTLGADFAKMHSAIRSILRMPINP